MVREQDEICKRASGKKNEYCALLAIYQLLSGKKLPRLKNQLQDRRIKSPNNAGYDKIVGLGILKKSEEKSFEITIGNIRVNVNR